MTPRDRLVWGLVGALAFLVLLQGARLAAGLAVGLAPAAVGTLAAGATTTVLAPRVERRTPGNGRA